MSDPHDATDPVDRAYAQAEAVLSDDAARAARRARVLAAVAGDAATPAAAPSPRRTAWRRGGWLVAACVAGLAGFLAMQIYRPPPFQPQLPRTAPTALPRAAAAAQSPAAQTPADRGTTASQLTGPVPSPARQASAAPRAVPAPTPPALAPAAPPPPVAAVEAPRAFPAAPAPPPPADAASEQRATAPAAKAAPDLAGGERDELVVAPSARRESRPAPAASTLAAQPTGSEAAGFRFDRPARLRAAAAAGRTAEVEALLGQGVPVDASDSDGNTALMASIRAGHPGVAAILRRHGASLERQNRAGESARDLAAEKGDAALDRAIGLSP